MQEPRLALFPASGAPTGAVRMGQEWVLLELGEGPLNAGRASRWLRSRAPDTRVTAGLVTHPGAAGGGAAWLASEHRNAYVAPAAVRSVQASTRDNAQSDAYVVGVYQGRWLRISGDSLWAEPIDLADAPGSLLVYVPSLRWVYSFAMTSPADRELILRRVQERGWLVSRIGSPGNMAAPVAP